MPPSPGRRINVIEARLNAYAGTTEQSRIRRISDAWQMSCTGMLRFEDDLQCERIAHFLGLENIAFDLTIWAFES